MNWRRVGAANNRLECVSMNLGATFVDPNSWIRDVDFGKDGLHLKRNGARQLANSIPDLVELTVKIRK